MENKLKHLIENSENIVFFGGAGVSTESGIPDFRSESGLYYAQKKYGYSPERILSHTFFLTKTEEFYQYYRENMLHLEAKPNDAHKGLAKLEAQGRLKAVITQNIDGLHQMAGSKVVHELHGSVLRNNCMKCGAKYSAEYLASYPETIPKCSVCGGLIKPEVILYEEALDEDVIQASVEAIQGADILIVGGTSLVVYPATGLIRYFKGSDIVLINKTPTEYDSRASLVINEPIGKVFAGLNG
jgi:NAD-dependent deacetylase